MGRPVTPAQERYWPKVSKNGPKRKRMRSRCWVWTGFIGKKGYGTFWIEGKSVLAHRVAWFFEHGRWPAPGFTIDHLCRRRHCVRPSHLEEVPGRVNVLRGIGITARNFRKERCRKGHKLSGSNLHINPRGDRVCRACARSATARYAAKKRSVR